MDGAAWAQAVGTGFAGVGLALLAWQIALQRRDSARQAVALMMSELNSAEARRQLRIVYSRPPDQLVLDRLSSDEEREAIECVIAHVARLGFRVRAGHIDEDDAYKLMWDVVLRSAQQLVLHLDAQAQRRGYRHAPDFEWLARRFKERCLRDRYKLPASHESYSLQQLLGVDPLPVFHLPLASAAATAATHCTDTQP